MSKTRKIKIGSWHRCSAVLIGESYKQLTQRFTKYLIYTSSLVNRKIQINGKNRYFVEMAEHA
ncbi:MAG: hypothetical protein BGO78_13660 [Chloroflexi bacterium 44-23]|nr:MAG: hypothetical protein BGO78_13660 [Chloroflexi bacterium 44-23]